METFDITIVGGGVIGLAVASYVSELNLSVCLLEKHDSFGRETSSRNSEVIHSGIYYPQNTLKALLCVRGKELLYEICAENNIPYKKIGKYIVACDEGEVPELEKLKINGNRNGVEDLVFVSRKELSDIEPNIYAHKAMFCPSTGIVDSHKLMKFFEMKAKENNVVCSYNTEAIEIEKNSDSYSVSVKENDGVYKFSSRIVINCAGLYSDKLARMAGLNTEKLGYNLLFCKGEYFNVISRADTKVSRLVYPVPHLQTGGLGVHITLDLQGEMRLGPNAFYVDKIDYDIDPAHSAQFFESAKRYLPKIKKEDVQPGMVGMRPKLQKPNEDFRDFFIKHENENGLPGFINLIGIESPGLTASPAIGEYVSRIVDDIL